MLTNAQLIRELAKPGKVYMPILMAGDVCQLAVEKANLIEYLRDLAPDAAAPWCFYGDDQKRRGARWLDTQD